MPICSRIFPLLLCGLLSVYSGLSFGIENLKKPHQIISDLRQRMYVIGETTGKLENFSDAEISAVSEIQDYVAGGDPAMLVEPDSTGQTPLMAAAYMGYADVVGELLKSDEVRRTMDDKNPKGLSAWIYANIAFRQALWACNPTVFNDVFRFVPLYVTQPYYLESSENPYRKTRRLLEAAGAKADMAQAKQFWQGNCKQQTAATRKKIQHSRDLLDTVLSEGAEILKQYSARQRNKE